MSFVSVYFCFFVVVVAVVVHLSTRSLSVFHAAAHHVTITFLYAAFSLELLVITWHNQPLIQLIRNNLFISFGFVL